MALRRTTNSRVPRWIRMGDYPWHWIRQLVPAGSLLRSASVDQGPEPVWGEREVSYLHPKVGQRVIHRVGDRREDGNRGPFSDGLAPCRREGRRVLHVTHLQVRRVRGGILQVVGEGRSEHLPVLVPDH